MELSNGSRLEIARLSPVNGKSSADLRSLDLSPNANPDNLILGSMIEYRQKNPKAKILFLSNDNAFRVQARVFEFPVGKFNEQYNTVLPVSDEELMYSGLKKNILKDEELAEFRAHGKFHVQNPAGFYDNQFVILKDQEAEMIDPTKGETPENLKVTKEAVVARYRSSDQTLNHLTVKMNSKISNIFPKNLEQRLALDLLVDPAVTTVTLFGKAGSGKTLLSMAAALHQVDKKVYQKIYYAKAYELVGGKDKHGFLKGSYDDKTGPHHESFVDNLETIYGHDRILAARKRYNNSTNDVLREFGFEPIMISYSRGRSITKSVIIIDEAQNLTAQELKTLGTRVGEGSKLILIGDLKQIDLAGVRGQQASAFYKVVNSDAFKKSDLSGHVMLIGGLRSRTTDMFSDIFDEIEGIVKKK
jgi:PhoH-like ATPase